MNKKNDRFYTIISLTDAGSGRHAVIGAMAYVPGERLVSTFNINENVIKKKITSDESQIESLMVSAYLCKTRIESMSKGTDGGTSLDTLTTVCGGNISFGAFEHLCGKKPLEEALIDVFNKAARG